MGLILGAITKTCLYNFDPLKPHFYIVKLGFAGVQIRLCVLVRTASPLIVFSADDILKFFFLCYPENRFWHFILSPQDLTFHANCLQWR